MTGRASHADDDRWQTRAACRGTDVNLFVLAPGRAKPTDMAKAKAVCVGCPVIGPCLDEALRREPGAGVIRGGTTLGQRKLIRRQARGGP